VGARVGSNDGPGGCLVVAVVVDEEVAATK